MVIPNAILLSQTLFLCECEIVVPVIKLQMEGAPPKYFINYSPTIPHQTQLFHNYSTTFYYSTLQSYSKPNSSGCRHKLVQLSCDQMVYVNSVCRFTQVWSLNQSWDPWVSSKANNRFCGLTVHVYSVLSENQPNRANNARPTWSRPVLWETISNKIWGQDFVRRFRLKRLLKW